MFLTAFSAKAQFGNYQSLNAPFGARNAALGGTVVSLADGDIMQFAHNPAVLDSVESGAVGINFSPYFAGIYSFSGAYHAEFSSIGKLAFGMVYMDYGDFEETTDLGDVIGAFSANDFVLTLGKSHQLGAFTLGVNIKYAYSGISGYGSSVLLTDIGGLYRSSKSDFTVGLVFKNLGFVVHDFYDAGRNKVPFDVQLGASVKPEYMPVRFSISAYNLTDGNRFYEAEPQGTSRTVKLVDKLFRRINLGTEIIFHKNIQLLIGYSHLRRQELRLAESANGAGFSYGINIGIRQFKLRYTHATYHAAGGSDFFSIQTNLHAFNKNF